MDRKFLETMGELDSGASLPMGLLVDTFIRVIKKRLLCQLSYALAGEEAIQKGTANCAIAWLRRNLHNRASLRNTPAFCVPISRQAGVIRFEPEIPHPQEIAAHEGSAARASGPCRTRDVRTRWCNEERSFFR